MSRDDASLVSVVICRRDDLDNVRRCVDALGAQAWPRLEIVVADNNSAGGVAAVAAAAPHAVLHLQFLDRHLVPLDSSLQRLEPAGEPGRRAPRRFIARPLGAVLFCAGHREECAIPRGRPRRWR